MSFHAGNADVPSAIVTAGHACGPRPLRGGRDARAPRCGLGTPKNVQFPVLKRPSNFRSFSLSAKNVFVDEQGTRILSFLGTV